MRGLAARRGQTWSGERLESHVPLHRVWATKSIAAILATNMIVTRFAPSPTGYLHLGHAYAAWKAREPAERFLLRIEDLDRTRCREEFVTALYEDLAWLGLSWNEPVWRQSTRFSSYRACLATL